MSKTRFSYYPGCSSEGSAAHLNKSLAAIAPALDIELEEIRDWNCCGASVGGAASSRLPNQVLTGRNLAIAAQQGKQDVVTPCAACYLNTHGVNEEIRNDTELRTSVNTALAADDLQYEDDLKVRHACEILVNEVGLDKIRSNVKKPLRELKIAGYVGCQTVRPHAGTEAGGQWDNYDDPGFLDDFIEACGAEAVDYNVKTSCCGGSVSVMKPEKTMHLIKKILQAAVDADADMIATPCPLCQTNVEMYQQQVNKEFGTDFNIPTVYYSQLMAVAFGMDWKNDAALDQHLIEPVALIKKATDSA